MYLWPLGMRKGLRQFVIHTRHLYGYRLELACLEMEKQNNSHFFCCPKWWPNTCFPGKGFRSRSKYIALFDLVRGRQRQFFTNFAATQSASWAAAPLHQQCLSILFWYSWVLFNASGVMSLITLFVPGSVILLRLPLVSSINPLLSSNFLILPGILTQVPRHTWRPIRVIFSLLLLIMAMIKLVLEMALFCLSLLLASRSFTHL